MLIRMVVVLLFFLSPATSLAGNQGLSELNGFVVNVTGNGLLVVAFDHQAEIVRLAGIAYPSDPEEQLNDVVEFARAMVMDKDIRVQSLGYDPKGNILGRVFVGNRSLNQALLKAGLVQPLDQDKAPAPIASIKQ
jgi:endonuclease YncB( thermonuclease family)